MCIRDRRRPDGSLPPYTPPRPTEDPPKFQGTGERSAEAMRRSKKMQRQTQKKEESLLRILMQRLLLLERQVRKSLPGVESNTTLNIKENNFSILQWKQKK